MGLTATIAHRIGLQVRRRGSLELLDLSAARQVVQACPRECVAILGIEGFRVIEERTVPEMDAIADFSELGALEWADRITRSVAEAGRFLDEINDSDLWCEVGLVREGGIA